MMNETNGRVLATKDHFSSSCTLVVEVGKAYQLVVELLSVSPATPLQFQRSLGSRIAGMRSWPSGAL
jgi:hypothetical protein